MSRRDLFLSLVIFLGLFIIQESVINQIHLPLTGFNLLFISALTWATLSSPESAVVTGFVSGFFLDLSPANEAPFGLWTLVMVVATYLLAYFGTADETAKANPIGLVWFITMGVVLAELIYLLIGALFGLSLGSFAQVVRTLLGIAIWSAVVSPIILPLINRIRSVLHTSSL